MCGLGSQSRASNPGGGLRRLPGEMGSGPGRPERQVEGWGDGGMVQRDSRCADPAGGDTEMEPMEVQSGRERSQREIRSGQEVGGGVTEGLWEAEG